VLSATSSTDCIWIIGASPTLSALRAAAAALVALICVAAAVAAHCRGQFWTPFGEWPRPSGET
jgi:hypothetical protein